MRFVDTAAEGNEMTEMTALSLIDGTRARITRPMVCDTIGYSIRRARRQGFGVGASVLIGKVPGTVIGYNIASHGLYFAGRFPLLVSTDYGAVKCSADELRLRAGDGIAPQ
jgi:hypothetical protein